MTYEDIRREIEAKLGQPVPDPWWAYGVKERWVSSVAEGEESLRWLAGRFRDVIGVARQMYELGASADAHKPEPAERADASPVLLPASDPLALLNAQTGKYLGLIHSGIHRFRQRYLSSGLVAAEDVGSWVNDTWRKEYAIWSGAPEVTSSAAVHVDSRPRDPNPILDSTQHAGFVFWPMVAGELQLWAYEHVYPQGVLAALAKLSRELSKLTGWHEGHAATYVLTARYPSLYRMRIYNTYDSPAEARVLMDIHVSVSPSEVLSVYRQQRKSIMRIVRHPKQRRGKRPFHELVFFVDETPDLAWRERLLQWNAKYPAWSYGQRVGNMQRDFKKAVAHSFGLRAGDAVLTPASWNGF
ncbi:MAG: hypothetical protein ACYDCQ_06945 [Dehalococcoidia bacterium]